MAKKVVWTITPECPDEFLDKLFAEKDEVPFYRLLAEGHTNGYVEIFGQTERDIKDIAACLQEFMSVKVIEG